MTIQNNQLPGSDKLLPGTAAFSNHPGYSAQDCELREVVVAASYATNNGFRCYWTGGHCVPGEHCEARRKANQEQESREAQYRD